MNGDGIAGVSVSAHDEPAAEDLAVVGAGLGAYNAPFVGDTDETRHQPLAVLARRSGRVVGGAVGHSAWGWLFLRQLWVDEPLRRTGLGTTLVLRFEAAGIERGCAAVWLDTFSFQARPFYEKAGYRQFGELVGFPAGSTQRRHFMWKPLDGQEVGT